MQIAQTRVAVAVITREGVRRGGGGGGGGNTATRDAIGAGKGLPLAAVSAPRTTPLAADPAKRIEEQQQSLGH